MTEENKSVMNFPNLRFPYYTDEWKEQRLEDLGFFIGGGTPDTTNQQFWKGKIPWISSSDLSVDDIGRIFKTRFINDDAIKSSATKLVPKGGILMVSRVGIGKFAVADEDLCTSQDFTNLVTNQNAYFLCHYFIARSKDFVKLSQGTSIKGFTIQDIKSSVFHVPSLQEQENISAFLSVIDSRIQTQRKIIEQLETLIRSYREKLFSQKIRFNENGSDFPEWEIKKIKDVLKIGSGRDYKHLDVGNIPVYGTGGVITFVDSFLYDGETVCVGRKGTIDRPMYFSGKLWTVDTLFYTHSFYNSIPKFIFQLFQTVNWKEHNEASGVPSLSKNTIENLSVTIPSLEEQTKVANFLSYLQEKIETEKKISAQYEIQKKYLLANLFA
ncbi:hypothetical protein CBW16_11535 [Flavobacteriaceae bacterium JJC]|nr:hypothetical protein CBW16_11535 [Flavobacteriaceae bacterium JJC]